ncbi:hypothetical protein IPF37_03105 [bacterium]|nr:MAG: hypothetical protein IPF37_03105 [bacterium]
MKKRFLVPFVCILILTQQTASAIAEWTVLTYIQADSNLAPYAYTNINDMQKVGSTSNVNIIVQWDQPNNNKTWRYKINKGSRTEVGSLNTEMGHQPAQELITSLQWIKANYPAKKYALILWDHGMGVLDRSQNNTVPSHSWLTLPGHNNVPHNNERGILYDYTQGTFLNNPDLLTVVQQAQSILGQKLDILGMDACLMAMLEIATQVKDNANYLVSSEETIPGYGWPYSQFLAPLVANPKQSALTLSQRMVTAYKNYYKKVDSATTLSSIDLSKVAALNTALNNVVQAISNIAQNNPVEMQNMITAAYAQSTSFAISSYIDLYTFFSKLSLQAKAYRAQNKAPRINVTPLQTALTAGMKAITNAVVANGTGSAYPNAKGISIYFPTALPLGPGYNATTFYQQSQWINFLNTYA